MHRISFGGVGSAVCLLICFNSFVAAQPAAIPGVAGPTVPTPAPQSPPVDSGGLTIRDSSVGYIDSASIGNQARIRADFGWNFPFPNRAEFFYAQGQPRGPGLPFAERRVDFQDYSLYLEKTASRDASIFVEGVLRSLNPELNRNALGWGDANIGLKYTFWTTDLGVLTGQLRTYLPTGSADRGLGTHNVSLEPALLGFARLTEDLGLAAELRFWQPINGTDFAGSIIRYGLGVRYDLCEWNSCRLSPTLEAIGWCVLGGRESQAVVPGVAAVRDSSGTSVLNLKIGTRLDIGDRAGLYIGYGRVLSGDRWYSDIVRAEFRWLF